MKTRVARTDLFNCASIYCLQKKEALYLAKEVAGYLQHGVSVKAGDVVFDVGANIGIFSLWLHLTQTPHLQIYAFEPVKTISDILEMNAKAHAPSNITVMPMGLGKQNENIELTYYPKATVWSTSHPDLAFGERGNTKTATLSNLAKAPFVYRLVPKVVWSAIIDSVLLKVFKNKQKVSCRITTISDVIENQAIANINLLKIDAEYAEWDVLQGIAEPHWPLVKQIVMELHDVDGRLEKVKQLLSEKGFQNLVIEQQELLSGTNVYQVYAAR